MDIVTVLKFSKATNNCPNCGSDKLGTDNKTGKHFGKYLVEEYAFYRSCACGFEVTLTKGMGDKEVEEAIAKAVNVII